MKKASVSIFFVGLFFLAGTIALHAQDTLSHSGTIKAKMDSLKNALTENGTRPERTVHRSDSLQAGASSATSGISEIIREGQHYSAEELLHKADSLRKAYEFEKSVALYQAASDASSDSLQTLFISEKMILGENGLNLMDYCDTPKVVTKQKFSIRDFFLFYPMKDNSWRPLPNQLDSSEAGGLVRAIFLPEDASSIFYSSVDKDGIRNIYQSHFADSLWSAPELINEGLTSSSNDIYPVLSPDGNTLYFASEGLYGMGGYDLYSSSYNNETKDWGTPINMGFPYSSPYDDFLYMDTEDGRYSIFASNRECSRDSVYLYVLEYDALPIRKKVSDVSELRRIARLTPQRSLSRIDNSSLSTDNAGDSEEIRRYVRQMNIVRELRDSVSNVFTFEEFISELPAAQARLDEAVKALQEIEMEFLVKGIALDPDKLQKDAERQVVGAASGYTFIKHTPGSSITLDMEEAEEKFDYTFKILPEAQLAADNNLPEGLVYQIQLFTLSKKASLNQLKGLSPVFEKQTSPSKYVYSVGIFRTYNDVLSHLNSVKRLGFKSAAITAYLDGHATGISNARSMESKMKMLFSVRIYPESQQLDEQAVATIRELTDADITRYTEDGTVIYEIGPMDSKVKAETLLQALKATGIENATIIENKKP